MNGVLRQFLPVHGFATLMLVGAVSLSTSAFAEDSRFDYDLDDNRLIEINDIDDLVQMVGEGYAGSIRATGSTIFKALYGSDDGCPEPGCVGYELTGDIDLMQQGASGNGSGNQMLAALTGSIFSGVLEGNGYAIRNFQHPMNMASHGLFQIVQNATIRNLVMEGEETLIGSLDDPNLSGGGALLAGVIQDSLIQSSRFEGVVAPGSFAAGLGYQINNSTVVATTINVRLEGYEGAGIATQTTDSLYIGNRIEVESNVGGRAAGLFLQAMGQDRVIANRVVVKARAEDATYAPYHHEGTLEVIASLSDVRSVSGASVSFAPVPLEAGLVDSYLPEGFGIEGEAHSLSELDATCAWTAGALCNDKIIFPDWDSYLDDAGQNIWQFTDSAALPEIASDLQFPDSDNDQVLNRYDAFPDQFEVAIDADADGVPDAWHGACDDDCKAASGIVLDAFPDNGAASVDADADGRPDRWNDGCDANCQSASGLTLDDSAGNAAGATGSAALWWLLGMWLTRVYRLRKKAKQV